VEMWFSNSLAGRSTLALQVHQQWHSRQADAAPDALAQDARCFWLACRCLGSSCETAHFRNWLWLSADSKIMEWHQDAASLSEAQQACSKCCKTPSKTRQDLPKMDKRL
jgi:hypothetical protein